MAFKMKGHTLPGPHKMKSPAKAKPKTYSMVEDAPKENKEKPIKKDDLSGTDFFGQPTKKSEKDALELFLEKHLETKPLPMKSPVKQTSDKMKKKVADVKAANLKETNEILKKQGKALVEEIKEKK